MDRSAKAAYMPLWCLSRSHTTLQTLAHACGKECWGKAVLVFWWMCGPVCPHACVCTEKRGDGCGAGGF